ncbi:bifunctional GDP-fucose synthetase: GDP-4-dehydro-6-deoxy-D-mannose epimerase and GDP-4-dehydro-6-L-deoxygalactose reductase [uncultured Dysgonomonas sp.]|uniref:GDP-L-fucose synthase n=1 Tax=uncultured Dysgonomonas sp. TaxID=206096 RepID=A0A212J7H3_9BACT|nr:bifunctional GDP-fucose synthetase: GDP-4-dehydro-6-deoxy-D-mannose epimerase and GDP-4-dehydro-6-L-deoxygalactose reductase [uncultured Dysgonomonas sp.]
MIEKDAKIYIAGHRGLVGSAILRNLKNKGYTNFILKTYAELDLTSQTEVADFFAKEKPEYVFLAAAKVGGIVANNTYRGQFIYENLMIQNNVIHQSYVNNVKKLVFLGSSCIYPKEAFQPMSENVLLTGPLEYTNEPYAIAKIAGLKMCESYNIQYNTNFIAVMPTNLYGPNDNFNLETSHVLPAMIRKIHLGKCLEVSAWDIIRKDFDLRPIEGITGQSSEEEILNIMCKYGVKKVGDKVQVELWGSGKPMREFLWSDEMADATVFVMESVNFLDLISVIEGKEIRNTHINVGTGVEISIKDVANIIKKVVDFSGDLWFNTEKPDGTMRKLSDVSKLNSLGWKHKVEIEDGLNRMYSWYNKYIVD